MCGYQDIGVALYMVYVIFILDILIISLAYDSIYSTYVLVQYTCTIVTFCKGGSTHVLLGWISTPVLSTIVTPPYANVNVTIS